MRTAAELGQLATVALPAIVKPNFEGSSKGITAASVATGRALLVAIARDLLARYPDGVVIEPYVDGVDVAVGWIDGLGLLEPVAYRYRATGEFTIYDYALKHGPPDRVQVEVPARVGARTLARIGVAATRCFAALGVSGYGRADFRVTPGGDVVFLEMNPLPSLAPRDNELYLGAAHQGCTPRDVIAGILAAPLRQGIDRAAPVEVSLP